MTTQYWVWKDQVAVGPYSMEILRVMHKAKEIDSDTLICPFGSETWNAYESYANSLAAQKESQNQHEAEDEQSLIEKYRKIFIGNNADYYIRIWRANQSGKIFASWNWPAFFLGPTWLLYRKMYQFYLFLLVIRWILFPLLLLVATLVLGSREKEEVVEVMGCLVVFNLAVPFVIGIFANSWYQRHADIKIERILCKTSDPAEQELSIKRKGGTGIVLPIVRAVMIPIIITGIFIGLSELGRHLQDIFNRVQT
jgi:hypothetical protein